MSDSSEPEREYRLTTGTYMTGGKTYRRGDKLLLTDKKAQEMGERVKPVIGGETRTITPTTNTSPIADVDWSRYRDMKAPDLIAEIKDTNSMDDLLALKDVEENGQNRIGVLKEIDKQVKKLKGEE